MAKSKNLFHEDPTRTLTLRNRAVAEVNRRYKHVNRLIRESIVSNKIFSANAEPLTRADVAYMDDEQKISMFETWLAATISEIILSGSTNYNGINDAQLNWLLLYISEAYEGGVKKANAELRRVLKNPGIIERLGLLDVKFHRDKLNFLLQRDFTQLKGVTEIMSQQLLRELSDGLINGESPNKIAPRITDRVNKIGITRSKLIARTEIIRAQNLAKVYEGIYINQEYGIPVVYEWITSGDAKVRPTHVRRGAKYYTSDALIPLLGEPNCRCAIIATPLDNVPKETKIIT